MQMLSNLIKRYLAASAIIFILLLLPDSDCIVLNIDLMLGWAAA